VLSRSVDRETFISGKADLALTEPSPRRCSFITTNPLARFG
jgi:hypothetical protein